MFKKIEAVLKSASLDSDDEHRTAYCQLHISPFERDLAVEISLEMADGLFLLAGGGVGMNRNAVFVPRLKMSGSVWDIECPVQKMEFRADSRMAALGTIDSVEIRHMHVQRTKKAESFTLVLGIYFKIMDWDVAAKFFERLKGTVALSVSPMGQKNLPLQVTGVEIDREETVAEFANAKASKKGGRKPVAPTGIQRVGRK